MYLYDWHFCGCTSLNNCIPDIVNDAGNQSWTMSDFSGNSAKLALESIRNAYFRDHYVNITRQVADDIMEQAKQAESLSPCQQCDIWEGAARKAYFVRNSWMDKTRKRLSASALAFSMFLKHKAPTFSELVARYRLRYYGNQELDEFSYLRKSEKVTVYRMIVSSAGRTNSKVNNFSKLIGIVGAISLVLITVLFIYGITYAKCAIAYSLKSAITFQTGMAGAYLGSRLGSAVASLCGGSYAVVFWTSLLCGLSLGFGAAIVGNSVVTTVFVTIYHADISALQLNVYL